MGTKEIETASKKTKNYFFVSFVYEKTQFLFFKKTVYGNDRITVDTPIPIKVIDSPMIKKLENAFIEKGFENCKIITFVHLISN